MAFTGCPENAIVSRTAFFGDIVDTINNNDAITRIEYMTFRAKDRVCLFFKLISPFQLPVILISSNSNMKYS